MAEPNSNEYQGPSRIEVEFGRLGVTIHGLGSCEVSRDQTWQLAAANRELAETLERLLNHPDRAELLAEYREFVERFGVEIADTINDLEA